MTTTDNLPQATRFHVPPVPEAPGRGAASMHWAQVPTFGESPGPLRSHSAVHVNQAEMYVIGSAGSGSGDAVARSSSLSVWHFDKGAS